MLKFSPISQAIEPIQEGLSARALTQSSFRIKVSVSMAPPGVAEAEIVAPFSTLQREDPSRRCMNSPRRPKGGFLTSCKCIPMAGCGGGLGSGGVAAKGGVFRFHPESKAYELMFSCSGTDDPVKSGRGCFALGETRLGQCVFVAGGGDIGTQRALFTVGADSPPKVLHTYPVLDSPGDPGFIRGFTLADDGAVYFPSQKGGTHNLGTIQRLSADGSPPTIVYHFTGTTGAIPFTGLLPLPCGRLCGVTLSGGAYGQGAVFSFSPPSSDLPKGGMLLLSSLHHTSGEQIALATNSDGSSLRFVSRTTGLRIPSV